jgi:MSHA biogenesis protein MshN
MSLVNQMLKDLEQRRAALPSSDRLRGLRSAPDSSTSKTLRTRWPLLLIVTALAGSGFGWWIADNKTPSNMPPMAQATPAASVVAALSEDTSAPVAVAAAENRVSKVSSPDTSAPMPTLEIATVAALEVSTPPPAPKPDPAVIKPAPKPSPITTTAVARSEPIEMTAVMHKTLRTPSPQEQATQHFDAAKQALAANDLVLADSALRAALAADPAHSNASETLATLLIQQGQRDAATNVLHAALKQTPEQPRLAMLQARLFAEAGRDSEAVSILQTALANGDAEYQALLGALQQRLGNDTQAADAYRLALTSAPQRGIWWLGLGISLERSQQSADALAAYRNALRDTTLETQVSEYVRARIVALDSGRG